MPVIERTLRDGFGRRVDIDYRTESASTAIDVKITTARLTLHSVSCQDSRSYVKWFGDPQLVQCYGHGIPRTSRTTRQAVRHWAQRWKTGDPFSAFVVRQNNANIGHIIAGHGNRPGQSVMAYIFQETAHGQGLATEAAGAMMCYVRMLRECDTQVGGEVIDQVVATARQANKASRSVLKWGAGMHVTQMRNGPDFRYYLYEVSLT